MSIATPNETATKLLALELKQRCVNRAVSGGMDKWIDYQATTMNWLRYVAPMQNRRYDQLSIGQRREWASNVLDYLRSPDLISTLIEGNGEHDILDTPLLELKNIQHTLRPNLRDALKRLNLITVRDVLWYTPREHRDLSKINSIADVVLGTDASIRAQVQRIVKVKKGHIPTTEAILADKSGSIEIVWFGKPYIATTVKVGDEMVLSGKMSVFNGRKQMQNPEYELVGKDGDIRRTNTGGLIPFYASSDSVSQKMIRYATRKALDYAKGKLTDWASSQILTSKQLLDLANAFEMVHYPTDKKAFWKARRRLVFDELLFYQLNIQIARTKWRVATRGVQIDTNAFKTAQQWLLQRLKFELTDSQNETLQAVKADMASGIPMSRLIQGEVGSGKTVVALVAMLACNAANQTAALLAPTQVLADQHFMNLTQITDAKPMQGIGHIVMRIEAEFSANKELKIALLTSKLSGAKREKVLAMVNSGEIDIIIGTHAVLQDKIAIARLGLAVIDEQHRFGVQQRGHMARYEPRPHLLAMSATPIPRTLQLTVYGDMNISTMKQLPQGRRQVETKLIYTDEQRTEAYEIVKREVKAGQKAFVVCPFIEESDSIAEVRAVEVEYERLRNGVFSDLKLGLLNGKMPLRKKQIAIAEFRVGITNVLVATPVIEVGVDIFDATVMLVESADRFGLSQLHQLRGRVGRGGQPSWCLLAFESSSGDTQERLAVMRNIDDGFDLAEADLQMRGPGDYLGTRQSGWSKMRIARPSDVQLLKSARSTAEMILKDDIELRKYPLLKRELQRFGEVDDASSLDEALSK